ncbi:hypothetical protein MKEN_01430200 [Mycena kentingensis (nom. inval.)]|nr:hypothetical protein MKEN_01430200 [Mycena kentingensis (nom. inval.)]
MNSDDELDALTTAGEALVAAILAEEEEKIQALISGGAPLWYQTEMEGISCLHAAAYTQNLDLAKQLIEGGAVWNAVDYRQNTAGDIALSFNNEPLYALIRDAGIRSEIVLGLLSGGASENASTMVLRADDDSAAASSETFMKSHLRFATDENGQDVCMVDADGEEIGVMMRWEQGIMNETVSRMRQACRKKEDLCILNIGFGLGLIDTLFQSLEPCLHVIIEAHPDVLQHMKERGWYDKKGVRILEGKWQDFITAEKLGELVPAGGFNMVYTDPFSEDYATLRGFFKHVPRLLAPKDSVFSFFNGLGATNPTIYDVSTRLAELHLAELGLDVEWSDVDVRDELCGRVWGESRPYFTCPTYRLPVVVR